MKHWLLIPTVLLTACSNATAPGETAERLPQTQTVETVQVAEPMAPEIKAEVSDVKTKAVLVFADWCGSCKVLDPKVQAVKAREEIAGLEFVTLDYTLKDPNVFYAQANAAGVETAIAAYLAGTVKTGQLLLVDMDDQAVIGTVTKDADEASILSALKAAVAAS